MIRADNIWVQHGARNTLCDISVAPRADQVTVIVGPNGSGKSTLLRCLAGAGVPSAGTVTLDGRAIRGWPVRALARKVSYLPQSPQAPQGIALRDLVACGRFAHRRLWSGAADRDAVEHALAATGLSHLSDQQFSTLSGGERQRGWIAMAVAQQSAMVLLDEPTTWLDIGHQIEVLSLLRRLNRERGLGIVMVLHDMNHAAQYADHMIALKDGVIHSRGAPHDVLTPLLLRELFDVRAAIVQNGHTPHFMIAPDGDTDG